MSGESMSRGRSGGMGEWGYQPGVYVPLKTLFLVDPKRRLWVLVRTEVALTCPQLMF